MFLDISSAITAVYLTTYDSIEYMCVAELIKDECEIKFLDYIKNPIGDESIPIVRDCRETKEIYEGARTSDSKVLNPISKQALEFYNSKKDDEKASLSIRGIYYTSSR